MKRKYRRLQADNKEKERVVCYRAFKGTHAKGERTIMEKASVEMESLSVHCARQY